MNKTTIIAILAALAAATLTGCSTSQEQADADSPPLSFAGWQTWDKGLSAKRDAESNTVTLNGAIPMAGGYLSTHNDPALRNRTIILEVENTAASIFREDRLFKITVNRNDQLVKPPAIPVLLFGEYVPADVKRVEFTLPADFDGKLGLVFYQAELKDLQITAWYK